MADPQISSTTETTPKQYVLTSSNLKEGMTLSEAQKAGKELASYFQFADKDKDGKMSLDEKLNAQQEELRQMEARLARAKDAQKYPGRMIRDDFGVLSTNISDLGLNVSKFELKIKQARIEMEETEINILKRKESRYPKKDKIKLYDKNENINTDDNTKSNVEFKA